MLFVLLLLVYVVWGLLFVAGCSLSVSRRVLFVVCRCALRVVVC